MSILNWKIDWNGGMEYGMDYELKKHFHGNTCVAICLLNYRHSWLCLVLACIHASSSKLRG